MADMRKSVTGELFGSCGRRSAAQLGQKPCSATHASVTDRVVWVGPLKTTVYSAKPSSHQ